VVGCGIKVLASSLVVSGVLESVGYGILVGLDAPFVSFFL
jgi:hypothetical protein